LLRITHVSALLEFGAVARVRVIHHVDVAHFIRTGTS
jgi:hypothetical protein